MSHSINSVPRQLTLFSVNKRCFKCGESKPLDMFSKCSGNRDGLQSYCKPCMVAANAKWRFKNPELARAAQSKSRAAIPDIIRQRNRAYNVANRERRRLKANSYRGKNRELYRQAQAKRRSMMRGNTTDDVDYKSILERDGYVCHICGDEVDAGDIHFDHIIPLSKGGPHSMDNIAVAHSVCNIRKGAKILTD